MECTYTEDDNIKNHNMICGVYSLFTLRSFFENGIVDHDQHLKNLKLAASCEINKLINHSVDFSHLIRFQSSCGYSDIKTVSVNPLSKCIEYEKIFDDEKDIINPYAILFRKHCNYFTILIARKEGNIIYSIRDCHVKDNYDIIGFKAIKEHLNNVYKFNTNSSCINYVVVYGGIHILLSHNRNLL